MPDSVLQPVARAVDRVLEIVVAYVIGSRARGRPRPDSDLDVAVAYRSSLDGNALETARRRLLEELTRELGALGERADIVDLRRVGTAVAFRANRDGRVVACRDRLERVRLEASIARAYDDEAPRRRLFREAARRAGERMAREAEADGRS